MDALCEHSQESFFALVKEIMSLGYDEETAGDFAVFIGDTPLLEQGRVVVKDKSGDVIARLKLRSFQDCKYELAFYRGIDFVECWKSEACLDDLLSSGAIQMPGWKKSLAVQGVTHQFEDSRAGRSYVDRAVVHVMDYA